MTTLICGVGDSALGVLRLIANEKLRGIETLHINTHPSPFTPNLILGESEVGASGNPVIGQTHAENYADAIYKELEDVDRLILVGGLGGGTATGSIPVIARYAQELELNLICIVSLPFTFEGDTRASRAQTALPRLQSLTTTYVVNADDVMTFLAKPNFPDMQSCFAMLDRWMAWQILSRLLD